MPPLNIVLSSKRENVLVLQFHQTSIQYLQKKPAMKYQLNHVTTNSLIQKANV